MGKQINMKKYHYYECAAVFRRDKQNKHIVEKWYKGNWIKADYDCFMEELLDGRMWVYLDSDIDLLKKDLKKRQ